MKTKVNIVQAGKVAGFVINQANGITTWRTTAERRVAFAEEEEEEEEAVVAAAAAAAAVEEEAVRFVVVCIKVVITSLLNTVPS